MTYDPFGVLFGAIRAGTMPKADRDAVTNAWKRRLLIAEGDHDLVLTPREEASAAGRAAYDAAEALAILLDRDVDDYGEKPEILDSIIARLVAMADEVRAALGEPKP